MSKLLSNKFFLIKLLAIIGIGLAVYLLLEQIYQPDFRPCTINAAINCDAIIDGPVAKTLGIPTPLYGLIGYTAILVSAFLKKRKTILGFASFGLAFCLWIAFEELVLLKVICPVCIACQIIMITTFVLSYLLYKNRHLQTS